MVLLSSLTAGCQSAHLAPRADHSGSASPVPVLCRSPNGAAWRRVLTRHVIPLSRHASVVPWALAGDARTFFASVYSRRFSGVVRIDGATGRFTAIRRFGNARRDQADGSFDGRFLVWNEYHSLSSPDDFTTWSWDSVGRRLRRIGGAARSPSGTFWPSPWRQPDAREGFATWTQGSGAEGIEDVHVVRLTSGHGRVVRHGHPGGSFLVSGGLVVWPESMRPGAVTVMRAADAATGRPVSVPNVFRSVRGVSGLATDGRAVAYPNADYTSLWWSPSLDASPRRLFATRSAADHIDNSVQVAGSDLTFGVPPATFLADAKTGRYVRLSRGGYARIDRRTLVLVEPSAEKAIHPVSDVVFVPRSALPPLLPCL